MHVEPDITSSTTYSNKCTCSHTHCGALWMANVKYLLLTRLLQNKVHGGWNVILSHFIKATKQRQKVSCVRNQWGTAAQSFPAQIICVDIKKSFFWMKQNSDDWVFSFLLTTWVSAHYTNLKTPLYCPYMCDNTCNHKNIFCSSQCDWIAKQGYLKTQNSSCFTVKCMCFLDQVFPLLFPSHTS